jgi:hypothetical protein
MLGRCYQERTGPFANERLRSTVRALLAGLPQGSAWFNVQPSEDELFTILLHVAEVLDVKRGRPQGE